jgi:excisionase family DNA binding protein
MISPVTKMFDYQTVADELGVHKCTVEEWVKDPQIGLFKMGEKIRKISQANLTEFVLGHTVNPKRPKWLTAPIECEHEKKMREWMRQEWRVINAEAQRHEEREAA